MKISKDSTSFQSLKCYPSKYAIRAHLYKKMKPNDVEDCLYRLYSNKVLTELNLTQEGKPRLKAAVDGKTYKETWFRSAKKVLNKALKTSNEAHSIELIAEVMKILIKAD